VALPQPSASAQSPVDEVKASAGIFKKDRLVACIDASASRDFFEAITTTLDARNDPTFLLSDDLETFGSRGDTLIGDMVNQGRKGVAAGLVPTGKAEGIKKHCGEQFPGRTVIGRCEVTRGDLLGANGVRRSVNLSLVISHYDLSAIDSMARGCLAAKGDWWELPRDSAEYQRERRQQALDRAIRAVDQAAN
jgi:hypothetical protein